MDFHTDQFSYFDVETPSLYQDSICQIAVIGERDGESVVLNYLVNPEDEFHPRNVAIHGITRRDVAGAPTFPQIWPRLTELFKDRLVIGHNVRFDLSVLFKNIYHYGLEPFDIFFIDTMDLLRFHKVQCGKGLKDSCRYFGIDLERHHDALADTQAARDLFLVLTQSTPDLTRFINRYEPGQRCFGYQRELFRSDKTFTRTPPVSRASQTTGRMAQLKELLLSITPDQPLTNPERLRLNDWLLRGQSITRQAPLEQISAAISRLITQRMISRSDHGEILALIDRFVNPQDILPSDSLRRFSFRDQIVCLTGDFRYGAKPDVEETIQRQGGCICAGVTKKTTVVLIGALGSARWSYGSFGSKVKKAMELKATGQDILILAEADIHLDQYE